MLYLVPLGHIQPSPKLLRVWSVEIFGTFQQQEKLESCTLDLYDIHSPFPILDLYHSSVSCLCIFQWDHLLLLLKNLLQIQFIKWLYRFCPYWLCIMNNLIIKRLHKGDVAVSHNSETPILASWFFHGLITITP